MSNRALTVAQLSAFIVAAMCTCIPCRDFATSLVTGAAMGVLMCISERRGAAKEQPSQ